MLGVVAIEPKGLLGDLGDAREFLVGDLEVPKYIFRHPFAGLRQVDEVGHRFQWVIDLMGDGGRETAGRGEFFRLHDGHLGILQLGDVAGDRNQPLNLSIVAEHRRDLDVPTLGNASQRWAFSVEASGPARLRDRKRSLRSGVVLFAPEVDPAAAKELADVVNFKRFLAGRVHVLQASF